jgi:hypothetical protein
MTITGSDEVVRKRATSSSTSRMPTPRSAHSEALHVGAVGDGIGERHADLEGERACLLELHASSRATRRAADG